MDIVTIINTLLGDEIRRSPVESVLIILVGNTEISIKLYGLVSIK